MDGFIIVGGVWLFFLVGLWIALGKMLNSNSVEAHKGSKISRVENFKGNHKRSFIGGKEKEAESE